MGAKGTSGGRAGAGRDGLAVFLFGAGSTFGAGNVGPVVPELSHDFGLMLASVGLISGTAFYSAVVAGLLLVPRIAERLGGIATMRVACVALGFSASLGPVFASGSSSRRWPAGFALPYAVMIVSSQRLFPEEPAEPVSLLTAIAVALPIALIPLFGAALTEGYGEEALFGIAAFIAIAAALQPAAGRRAVARDGRRRIGCRVMDQEELEQRLAWVEASVRRVAGSVTPPVTLPPHPLDDPGQISDEVRTLASAGQTMQAIQLHRQQTGAGLAEAKQAVESL